MESVIIVVFATHCFFTYSLLKLALTGRPVMERKPKDPEDGGILSQF